MIRTQDLDNHEFDPVDPWGEILDELVWAIHLLYHRTYDTTLSQPGFSRDMTFSMAFTPDWDRIRERKRVPALKDNK